MISAKENVDNTDSFITSKATSADIKDLEEVVNLAYRGGKASVPWKNENHLVKGPRITTDELTKHLSAKGSTILLIRDKKNATLAGCVHIEINEQEAHIGMLTVHPEYQNLGLGKKLLNLAGDFAKNDMHCKIAKMCVLGGREELLAWYKKMGYELTGESMPFFGPESGLTPLCENPHFVVVKKAL